MQSGNSRTTEPIHAPTAEQEQASFETWLEQSIKAVGGYAKRFCKTFATLLAQPSLASQLAISSAARPRTFLIFALLISGLMIQTVMLYRGRLLDSDLFGVFTMAIAAWGIRELLLLTIPPLLVVWAISSATGWLANINRQSQHSSFFFGGICHAVGVQLIILAMAALSFIGLKAVPGGSGEDHHLTRDFILIPILLAVVLSGLLQVQKLLSTWGRAGWTQRWWLRIPLSTLVSLACICGVVRLAAETFDFHTSKQLGSRLSMEAWSGKARVLVDVLSSRNTASTSVSQTSSPLRVEQQIALTNVTDLPHAIPFPAELKIRSSSVGPVSVACEPRHPDAQAGWVLQPGETRIVSWVLRIPQALVDRDMTVASFSCVEIDIERWHQDIERPLSATGECYISIRPSQWSSPNLR